MSTSSVLLPRCASCSALFKEADSLVESGTCVVTACFHAFHLSCLGGWVTGAEKTCPSCRNTCYQHQAGKDFPIIWKIFIKVLSTDPSTVLEVLESTIGETENYCPTCFDDFGVISVYFDRETKRLVHQQCSSSTKTTLTLNIISRVVQKCAEKDFALAKLLTPSPPSVYQRLRRNNPAVFENLSGLVSSLTLSTSNLYPSRRSSSAPPSLSSSYSSMPNDPSSSPNSNSAPPSPSSSYTSTDNS